MKEINISVNSQNTGICPAAHVTNVFSKAAQKLNIDLEEMFSLIEHKPPMFTDDGDLIVPMVTRMAEYFGLTFESLMNADLTALDDFLLKYPYFFESRSYSHYLVNRLYTNDSKGHWERIHHIQKAKYKRDKLYAQPDDDLQKMDNRARKLFAKALRNELTESEINEYNIIVTLLNVKDPYFMAEPLHYSVFQLLKSTYLQEGFLCHYLVTDVKNSDKDSLNNILDSEPCEGYVPFLKVPEDLDKRLTRIKKAFLMDDKS